MGAVSSPCRRGWFWLWNRNLGRHGATELIRLLSRYQLGSRLGSYVGAPAAHRHDKTMISEQLDGLAGRAAGYSVFLPQRGLARYRPVGLQLAGLDLLTEDAGKLDVDRHR